MHSVITAGLTNVGVENEVVDDKVVEFACVTVFEIFNPSETACQMKRKNLKM